MLTRGIRGAITVDKNDINSLKLATIELLTKMMSENSLKLDDICCVNFSLTKDINCAFPAKFAREDLGFDTIPMECYQELDVNNSLEMCLRVMMLVNTDKSPLEISHIYLKGAKVLRKDLLT